MASLKDLRVRIASVKSTRKITSAMLDVHLKANAVPGGIRSYSDIVELAVTSQPRWKEFE